MGRLVVTNMEVQQTVRGAGCEVTYSYAPHLVDVHVPAIETVTPLHWTLE